VCDLTVRRFVGVTAAGCIAALILSGCATTSSHPYYDRFRHAGPAPKPAVKPKPATVYAGGPAPARPTASRVTTVGQRFAVVIGISQYSDSRIPPLRYGAKDAKSFHDWLVSPSGGRYAPDHVHLLLDQQATVKAIREALFVWAKRAIKEDMLTIYFACHGSPESPDSPENLFVLPYDADYDNIAATGFPMWDIETAMRRFIKARKIVVIADACHSGGVGAEFASARRGVGVIEVGLVSSGLQKLSGVGDGVAVLTASGANQLSQEAPKWGGGHGVFTHFLLTGLRGDADYNGDKQVTLGELIPYLSEKVRRETRNAQCPEVAGKFDPALGIAR